MKRMRDIAACLTGGALLGAMLARPETGLHAALGALNAFATKVLPALMPQLFLMLMLSSRVAARGAFIVPMAWLCGSPGGAKLVSRMAANPRYTGKLCAMTGTMSPGFFLGTIGALTGDQRAARGALICHLLSAALTGILFGGKHDRKTPLSQVPMSISDAASDTARAMLSVCVMMTVGAVASSLAQCLLPLPSGIMTALSCLIEVTGGVIRLSSVDSPLKYPLLCAACSFSGLSIIFQTAVYYRKTGMTILRMIGIRLIHGVIAFLLSFLLFCVFKLS